VGSNFFVKTTTPSLFSFGRILTWTTVTLLLLVNTGWAATRWSTLEAIHFIENPHNSTRPGSHGELGAYQFRQETWQMYTTTPFARALDRGMSDAVAIKHYEWLKARLERSGVPATPYTIALAWNGGITGAVNGHPPRAAREYAERVANMALSIERAAAGSNAQ
jgi:hypothetical protein